MAKCLTEQAVKMHGVMHPNPKYHQRIKEDERRMNK